MRRLHALVLAALLPSAPAAAEAFGPFGTPTAPLTREAGPEAVRRQAEAPPSHVLAFALLFYQKVVSPIDGPRCSHYPTCSAYAAQAIRRRGLAGLLMTVDRVWMTNLSSPLRPLPLIQVHDAWRYYHPLDEALDLPVPPRQIQP